MLSYIFLSPSRIKRNQCDDFLVNGDKLIFLGDATNRISNIYYFKNTLWVVC